MLHVVEVTPNPNNLVAPNITVDGVMLKHVTQMRVDIEPNAAIPTVQFSLVISPQLVLDPAVIEVTFKELPPVIELAILAHLKEKYPS